MGTIRRVDILSAGTDTDIDTVKSKKQVPSSLFNNSCMLLNVITDEIVTVTYDHSFVFRLSEKPVPDHHHHDQVFILPVSLSQLRFEFWITILLRFSMSLNTRDDIK